MSSKAFDGLLGYCLDWVISDEEFTVREHSLDNRDDVSLGWFHLDTGPANVLLQFPGALSGLRVHHTTYTYFQALTRAGTFRRW